MAFHVSFIHCSYFTDTRRRRLFSFFFFNDTATTEIYTLSLHDALPISGCSKSGGPQAEGSGVDLSSVPPSAYPLPSATEDRKSTRLNSSHSQISYAVFCLKKKKGNADARY